MPAIARTQRVTITALFLLASMGGGLCADRSAPGLEPDPEIRAQIERAVVAVVQQEDAARDHVERLRDLADGRREGLLLQLALYLSESDSTEESMGGALILHRLDFSAAEKLDAILPHLEAAAPPLRHVFTELLGTIDRPEGGEPDFGLYEARLRREPTEPPAALIRYLYGVSPDAALESMRRVYAGGRSEGAATAAKLDDLRDVLAFHGGSRTWSTEDRARARAALDALSGDVPWWIRLYAAAIMNRHPDLATSDLTDRVRRDPDPLVRGALLP